MVRHLAEQGYLGQDGGLLFVGPEAERRYGHRHFMSLTAVFTAPPEFTVFNGRTEIGRTDLDLLTEHIEGPRKLLLALPHDLPAGRPALLAARVLAARTSNSFEHLDVSSLISMVEMLPWM